MMNENSKTILVRNLPPSLTEHQITELLLLFKATSIKYMGKNGKMKNCAFASFITHQAAAEAMRQLHQVTILNYVLRVEYAKSQLAPDSKELLSKSGSLSSSNKAKTLEATLSSSSSKIPNSEPISKIDSISKKWGLDYTVDDSLTYIYPAPTETTLNNIVHCMASIPKFYVQVLHLMNKMHLPPPFGELTTAPPIPRGLPDLADQEQSEESEMESSDEEKPVKKVAGQKRTITLPTDVYAKRLRSQIALTDTLAARSNTSHNTDSAPRASSVQDAFEVVREQAKQVRLNLPAQVTLPTHESHETEAPVSSSQSFGKIHSVTTHIEPPLQTSHRDPLQSNTQLEPRQETSQLKSHEETTQFGDVEKVSAPATTPYITSRELMSGRLSEGERAEHSILSKHTAGEPYTRLYIKNLAKQTTESQLKYIFGRYVNWNDENEVEAFNIRHMTEGRMKGQAFVTLPSIDAAEAAVTECHAYVLNGRPMAVAYAKPKT